MAIGSDPNTLGINYPWKTAISMRMLVIQYYIIANIKGWRSALSNATLLIFISGLAPGLTEFPDQKSRNSLPNSVPCVHRNWKFISTQSISMGYIHIVQWTSTASSRSLNSSSSLLIPKFTSASDSFVDCHHPGD